MVTLWWIKSAAYSNFVARMLLFVHMPDCLRCCVWGGRLLQPLCGVVVCGWTETRNSSIQYGRITFHCNVHRVGTHCVLLAVAERKPVIRRETMAACLEVLGSTVGRVWYLQSLFCVFVCVSVCVCVHAYANRMIDVITGQIYIAVFPFCRFIAACECWWLGTVSVGVTECFLPGCMNWNCLQHQGNLYKQQFRQTLMLIYLLQV
jgi:type IV secretory pathway TrbD component